jgi:hypothetical protein
MDRQYQQGYPESIHFPDREYGTQSPVKIVFMTHLTLRLTPLLRFDSVQINGTMLKRASNNVEERNVPIRGLTPIGNSE